MYKDVLRSIQGVEILPVIGLLIFVLFFASWAWVAFRSDKKYINKMKQMPLESSSEDEDQSARATAG